MKGLAEKFENLSKVSNTNSYHNAITYEYQFTCIVICILII